jgi:putative sigma-54 modulation protein
MRIAHNEFYTFKSSWSNYFNRILNNKYKNVETLEFNFNYEPEENEEEENVSAIVKRKNISMKPMDEEEAVLQIELLNHDFFVFKNIDEECVSVIYKRKDGNYGIINMK